MRKRGCGNTRSQLSGGGLIARAASQCSPRSVALVSIARGVSSVCKGLPEMVPAMGSRCKSRDQPTRSDSTLRTCGIGSPSTRRLFQGFSPRTREHRQKLGSVNFQTASPLQEQRYQTSVLLGFSAQRASSGFSYAFLNKHPQWKNKSRTPIGRDPSSRIKLQCSREAQSRISAPNIENGVARHAAQPTIVKRECPLWVISGH